MSWSKIKKSINSTLGTSDFKPLDKIILEAFEFIKTKLSKLTNSLTSGENEFKVKRSKECDLADKASQTAIPNISVSFITDGTDISIPCEKAGIYAITWAHFDSANSKDQKVLGFYETVFYYVSDAIIKRRIPEESGGYTYHIGTTVPIQPLWKLSDRSGDSSYSLATSVTYDSVNRNLIIASGGISNRYGVQLLVDIAFIEVNSENIIM
jgi:hypothetical protein